MAEEVFSAAILIVRNPLDALVAEWNRRTYSIAKKLAYPQRGSTHIASLPQMYFSEYYLQQKLKILQTLNRKQG